MLTPSFRFCSPFWPKLQRKVFWCLIIPSNTLISRTCCLYPLLLQQSTLASCLVKLIQFLETQGHSGLFLPKFHSELNPMDRDWAQSKQYTKACCKHTSPSLRTNVPLDLDSVNLENIRNFNCKHCQYMYAYFEGHVADTEQRSRAQGTRQLSPNRHERVKFNSLYPIVPNGISALFYDKTYFWHARRTAIAQRLQ